MTIDRRIGETCCYFFSVSFSSLFSVSPYFTYSKIHRAGKHTMWFLQRSNFLIGFLAFRLLRVHADKTIGLCCLCEYCDFVAPGRADFLVDEFGTTCYDVLLDMADGDNDSKPGNGACASLQGKYRRACCDASYQPPEVAQAPTPAPVINLSFGNEPVCNVCPDGGFPDKPKTVLAILYIPGNPTCEILYEMGKRGLIEGRLCNPIQDYLFEACGCNRNGSFGSGLAPILVDPPTRAPTQAPSRIPSPTQPPFAEKRQEPSSSVSKANYVLGAGASGRDRGGGGLRYRKLKGATS
jgi:hypothetical protein